MKAQLDRVISMASLPNVELGVLRLDQEAVDAYLHPFVVFELEDETLVTVETYSAALQVSQPQEVAIYQHTLERLRPAARWANEAIQAIRSL
jgi:Domain of unknown function (DUF5753)